MAYERGEVRAGWGDLADWGTCVIVRSSNDVPLVRGFVDDCDDARRAVVFAGLTRSEQRAMTAAIQNRGVELREFTAAEMRSLVTGGVARKTKLYILLIGVLMWPQRLLMHLQGRTAVVFEIAP